MMERERTESLKPHRNGSRVSLGWRLGATFAVAALLFLDPVPQSMAQNILGLATSLIDHGSVALHESGGTEFAMRDGRILSGEPPGASFIAAGVYVLTRPAFRVIAGDQKVRALYILCTILLGIPAAMATIYLVYRTAIGWGVPVRSAFLTAGLLAFGTMHFGYATGLYKKTLASACLMGAFVLLTSPRGRAVPWLRASLAGVLCSLAAGQDYPTVVIAAILGGYLLSRRPPPRVLVGFGLGAAIAILPVLVYHQAAFGSPWVTGYHFRANLAVRAANMMGAPRPGAFLFLSLTLLAASPCLIWSALGWWRAIQVRERRAEMITIAAIVLGILLFFSCWNLFYGHEASFSSRLILPALPFAVLPMAFGLPTTLGRFSLIVIGWSVGATLLAAQASMIPSDTIPPVYALKVLGTSWGTGPLFSETLASWLGLPALHLVISRGVVSSGALLQPENRYLLVKALLGQALIKLFSLTATAIAAALLWRLVWRPVMGSVTLGHVPDVSPQPEVQA